MVDYDREAPVYQRGRALSPAVLSSWGAAALSLVPARRPLQVLDLGAGTGIFTRAWGRWCPCRIIAVEPSAGMRAQALSVGIPRNAALIAGQAEALGLRDGSVDVAWLSTVLHHFADRRASMAELGRVVVPGGAVLIRGIFAELGTLGWLPYFPGADRARRLLPSADETVADLEANGFELVDTLAVEGGEITNAGQAAGWVRQMRAADTVLGDFDDDEFDAGLAALASIPPEHRLVTSMPLMGFERR